MQNNTTVSKHDKENSRLTATFYHEQTWQQGPKTQNATFHYLKFIQESKEYIEGPVGKQLGIELGRVVNITESKASGQFSTNKIKTIIIYQNDNKGGKVRGIDNPMVMKIVFRNQQIASCDIYEKSPEWIDFLRSIAKQIQEKIDYYAKN